MQHGDGVQERGRRGRSVWAALAAALAVGLATGLVARLLMRLIALVIGTDGTFSPGATAAILITFVVLAVPAAATATARPVVRHGGRWATVALTGWASVNAGFADAKFLLLADEGRLPLFAALTVAFAALLTAHGRLTQHVARHLAAPSERTSTGSEVAADVGGLQSAE